MTSIKSTRIPQISQARRNR